LSSCPFSSYSEFRPTCFCIPLYSAAFLANFRAGRATRLSRFFLFTLCIYILRLPLFVPLSFGRTSNYTALCASLAPFFLRELCRKHVFLLFSFHPGAEAGQKFVSFFCQLFSRALSKPVASQTVLRWFLLFSLPVPSRKYLFLRPP